MRNTLRIMAMLIVLASVTAGNADDLSVPWFSIDGGGGEWSVGGDFVLSGTIGQPDAGATALTGGDFALVGGFRTGAVAETQVPGDFDDDGDVDLDDYDIVEGCLVGPEVTTPPPGCDPEHFANADLEGEDSDVDLADFVIFANNFTG